MGSSKTKAQNRYIAKAYDRVGLVLRKDGNASREIIDAHLLRTGESINGFITRAIAETIERDLTPSADP
jgi:hypothetical protein